jgi:hypothetical protein
LGEIEFFVNDQNELTDMVTSLDWRIPEMEMIFLTKKI